MAIESVKDLVEQLWRDDDSLERLRRAVLGDRALTARLETVESRLGGVESALVRLADAQARTDQRVEGLAQHLAELAEAQRRTEQRVNELAEAQRRTEQRVSELAEAQRRTEQRVSELAEAQRRTEEALASLILRVDSLIVRVDRMDGRMGNIEGDLLAARFEKRAGAYFGPWLDRPTVVPTDRVYEVLVDLPDADRDDAALIDLIVAGKPKGRAQLGTIHLAIEVSQTVDATDVGRAAQRATLIRRAGWVVVPVACGRTMTEGARREMESSRVALLVDGRRVGWDEALSTWATPAA